MDAAPATFTEWMQALYERPGEPPPLWPDANCDLAHLSKCNWIEPNVDGGWRVADGTVAVLNLKTKP